MIRLRFISAAFSPNKLEKFSVLCIDSNIFLIHKRFDTRFGAGGKTIAKLADLNDYCHFYGLTRLFSYKIREQKKTQENQMYRSIKV